MQSAKQKLSDLASTAKKKMVICRAKAEEKVPIKAIINDLY